MLINLVFFGGNVGVVGWVVVDVVGEVVGVVFIVWDDVELKLVVDIVRDFIRCVIIEIVFLDLVSVEVLIWVGLLILGEGIIEVGSMFIFEVWFRGCVERRRIREGVGGIEVEMVCVWLLFK